MFFILKADKKTIAQDTNKNKRSEKPLRLFGRTPTRALIYCRIL
jgi:hypothetical protein